MEQKGRRIYLKNRFEKNPPNTFRVSRNSIFGNPYKLLAHGGKYTRTESLKRYRKHLLFRLNCNPHYLKRLVGKNLACFCPLNQKCHVDILLHYLEKYENWLFELTRQKTQNVL